MQVYSDSIYNLTQIRTQWPKADYSFFTSALVPPKGFCFVQSWLVHYLPGESTSSLRFKKWSGWGVTGAANQMVALGFIMVFRRKWGDEILAHQVVADKKGVCANDVTPYQ